MSCEAPWSPTPKYLNDWTYNGNKEILAILNRNQILLHKVAQVLTHEFRKMEVNINLINSAPLF
jgi:hypothetical protein